MERAVDGDAMHAMHGWAGDRGVPQGIPQHQNAAHFAMPEWAVQIQHLKETMIHNHEKVLNYNHEQSSQINERFEVVDSRVERLEVQLENLMIAQKRKSCKITGVEEDKTETRDSLANLAVDIIRRNYRGWDLEVQDIEKIHRVGRHGRYPRPVIIGFLRQGDADTLLQNREGRDSLYKRGVRVGPDLTSKQREKMMELRERGQRGVLRGGKVVPAEAGFGQTRRWRDNSRNWRTERRDFGSRAHDNVDGDFPSFRDRHRDHPRDRHLVAVSREDVDGSGCRDSEQRGGRIDEDRRGRTEEEERRIARIREIDPCGDWIPLDKQEEEFPPFTGARDVIPEIIPASFPGVRGATVTPPGTQGRGGGGGGRSDVVPLSPRSSQAVVRPQDGAASSSSSMQPVFAADSDEDEEDACERPVSLGTGNEELAEPSCTRESELMVDYPLETQLEPQGGVEGVDNTGGRATDDSETEGLEYGGKETESGEENVEAQGSEEEESRGGINVQENEKQNVESEETLLKEVGNKDNTAVKKTVVETKKHSGGRDEVSKRTDKNRPNTRLLSQSNSQSSGQTNLNGWRERRSSTGEKRHVLSGSKAGKQQGTMGRGGGEGSGRAKNDK